MPIGPAFDNMFHALQTYIDWSESNATDLSSLFLCLPHTGELICRHGPRTHISAHATLEQCVQDAALRDCLENTLSVFQTHPTVQALSLNVAVGVIFGPHSGPQHQFKPMPYLNGSLRINRLQHDSKQPRKFFFGAEHSPAGEPYLTVQEYTQKGRAFLNDLLALPIKPTDPAWVYSYSTAMDTQEVFHPFHAPDIETARAIAAAYFKPSYAEGVVVHLAAKNIDAFIADNPHLRAF